MPEQDIEESIVNNELIGRWMGIEPEIEYCVGSGEASCFHPKQCGISWPPQQKEECEKWVNEHKDYAEREGYYVQKEEWWPWYNQDWNKLMDVIEKIDSLRINENLVCQSNATSHTFYIRYDYSFMVYDAFYNHGRHRAEGESRITNVYLAIIDFIKWYNSKQLNK